MRGAGGLAAGFGAANRVCLRVPDAAAVGDTRLPCRVTRDGRPRHRRPLPTRPPRLDASRMLANRVVPIITQARNAVVPSIRLTLEFGEGRGAAVRVPGA